LSRYFRAEVRENRQLRKNHNLLSLANLDQMTEPVSGQFYMLQPGKGYDPLLKRAFSLFRRTSEGLQILYRIKGRGTSFLSGMKPGEVVDMLGPLGNGYPLPSQGDVPLIIAGGIGIASVFSLAESLSGDAFVFYGAKMEDELLMADELQEIYGNLNVCTDDGSCGRKGTVMDVLHDFMESASVKTGMPVIYACGPHPLLRKIAFFAAGRGVRAYVSLEEHMACGIGACLGCVVRTKEGYKRVCKEGPVFEAGEIEW
jgi:dihydroorotate dehydrogenase electron transfer subunit